MWYLFRCGAAALWADSARQPGVLAVERRTSSAVEEARLADDGRNLRDHAQMPFASLSGSFLSFRASVVNCEFLDPALVQMLIISQTLTSKL